MEDHSIGPVPQQLTVVLDHIEKIIFQYQGIEMTLYQREILCLLDFIQYLYCNKGKLEKIFWREEN